MTQAEEAQQRQTLQITLAVHLATQEASIAHYWKMQQQAGRAPKNLQLVTKCSPVFVSYADEKTGAAQKPSRPRWGEWYWNERRRRWEPVPAMS